MSFLGVDSMMGLLDKLQSRDVVVHPRRCVRVRNRNASCHACFDACVSGCLSFEDGVISIDPHKCIGCSTCCTACPTCALEAARPNDKELMIEALDAMRAAEGHAVLASVKILEQARGLYDPAKVVSLANLGRIDESLIVALVRAGAHAVTLVQPRNAEGADVVGIRTANMVCDSANAILEVWGFAARARVSATFPNVVRMEDAVFDAGRREFFASIRDEAKDVASVSAEHVIEQASGAEPQQQTSMKVNAQTGVLPQFVPGRRGRLLRMLAGAGEPADEMVETRLWGHVIIDPVLCNGCRMCATFCPTGALEKYKDADGSTGVVHNPSKCVKCGCCESICRNEAIEISDAVFARDLLLGVVERYEMPPEETMRTNSHSIIRKVGPMFGANVFER